MVAARGSDRAFPAALDTCAVLLWDPWVAGITSKVNDVSKGQTHQSRTSEEKPQLPA